MSHESAIITRGSYTDENTAQKQTKIHTVTLTSIYKSYTSLWHIIKYSHSQGCSECL